MRECSCVGLACQAGFGLPCKKRCQGCRAAFYGPLVADDQIVTAQVERIAVEVAGTLTRLGT
ncbi:hypothetical protein D3C71_2116140 [compost metagenome]